MSGRVWVVEIPAPCEWPTSNKRERMHRMAFARLVKQWREAAYLAAVAAKLPKGLARVRIDGVARFRGHPAARDRLNLAPVVKAAVDGLGPQRVRKTRNRKTGALKIHTAVGYGLVPDDDDKHVDGPYPTIGDPLPKAAYGPSGVLVLTITELEG